MMTHMTYCPPGTLPWARSPEFLVGISHRSSRCPEGRQVLAITKLSVWIIQANGCSALKALNGQNTHISQNIPEAACHPTVIQPSSNQPLGRCRLWVSQPAESALPAYRQMGAAGEFHSHDTGLGAGQGCKCRDCLLGWAHFSHFFKYWIPKKAGTLF